MKKTCAGWFTPFIFIYWQNTFKPVLDLRILKKQHGYLQGKTVYNIS